MAKKKIKFYEDLEKTLQVYPELDPEEIPAGVKELLTEGSTITREGSSLALDSDILKIKDLQLLGDTKQTQLSGKNLFNPALYEDNKYQNYSPSNMSIANNNDWWITGLQEITPNETYTKSSVIAGGVWYDENREPIKNIPGSDQTITAPSNAKYICMSIQKTNLAFNGNIQLEQGQIATEYEPFVGGIPSPNPSYPQDINVVTGNQTIKVLGKNLYELIPNDANLNGLISTIENDGSISVSGTSTNTWSNICANVDILLQPGTYTFSVSKTYNYNCGFRCFTNKDGSTYEDIIIKKGNTKITNTFTSKIYGWRFFIAGFLNGGEINDNFKVQVEVGNTPTSYEKFIQQTKTISLGTIELNKIGNYQDKIYKQNDKWYLYKEIDKIILDGSENWKISTNPNTGTYRFDIPFTFKKEGKYLQSLLSNYFRSVPFYDIYNGTTEGITYWWDDSASYLVIRVTEIETKEDIKQWLSEHNPFVYYILETPTTTEITDTTLINQLNNIELNSGQNNIYVLSENNNLPVLLNIEAYTNVIDILDLKVDKDDLKNMGNGVPTGSIIGWNGDDSEIPGGYEITGLNNILYFDTVADMKAGDLNAGDMAITKGYYSANDGGGAEYNIIETTSNYSETLNNTLKAELIIKDSANVKQFGATGDGTTDDTTSITNAISNSSSIFIPEGTYKLTSSITLSKSTKIFGNSTIKTWGGHNKTTIISPTSDYAFKCSWGNSNDFENLTFDGYGLSAPSSCYINHCEFKGAIGILSARVATITNCSFNNCTIAGIQQITDTKVVDSFFYNNEIAIYMQNSNDNMIDSNKIEWNTNGIVIDTQVFNLITNNIFDRQTEYGIKMINGANTTINGNQFERNLLGHIYMSGTKITINNNILLEKNSEDDQSGTVVPQVSIVVNSVSHSIVENNTFTTERLFSTTYTYRLNLKQKNNSWVRNNNIQNTTSERIKLGTLSVPASSTATKYVSWTDIGYLHCNGYDVTIENVEFRQSNISRYGSDYITEIKNGLNSGLTIGITNDTTDDISGDIYITLTAIETTKI